MADHGSQNRKSGFTLAKVLTIRAKSFFGTRLNLRRSPTVLTAIGVVATFVLALMVVLTLLLTGGATAVSDNAALIGALVALGGVFTAQMVSIALNDHRTHEAALQNYFEEVGTLLIEKPLRRASPGDNLSTVVRAKTFALLDGLDADRKRILLQFLHESGLLYAPKPVVSLVAANLRKANLQKANLRWVNLYKADLYRANLREANLYRANLSWANLIQANMSSAYVQGERGVGEEADLSQAYLQMANLRGVNLTWANLSWAKLWGANLSGARVRFTDLSQAWMSRANLSGAIVRESNLSGASLFKADLRGAYLIGTDLSDASLHEANLSGANLSKSTGITNEELEQQAKLLGGATMPNGQKYEDWLKDKEGPREDEKNE